MQAAAHRGLAQGRVVARRAGEVLKQVAELTRLGDTQIDRDARVRAPARAGGARRGHALDLLERGQALGQRGRAGGGRDQVEILHAVRLPPCRSGELHVGARSAALAQARDQRLADRHRLGQQHARRGALGRSRVQRGEHAGLELGAESAHAAQPLRERRIAQRLRRVDAELRV